VESSNVEAPNVAGLLAFIKPLLTEGCSIEDLRRRVGSSKGKEWTHLLNGIISFVLERKMRHVATKVMYSNLKGEFSSTCGCLVNAMSTLPLTSNGNLDDASEKTILYSNLRTGKNARLTAGGKGGKSQGQEVVETGNGGSGEVSEAGMSELEWWASAVRHIELHASGLV
jgi:hypothetical protein